MSPAASFPRPLRIAILGAESTGKSTLSAALAAHFDSLWVPEYLREFVDTAQRTPQEHEQFHIASTQLLREQEAAAKLTVSFAAEPTSQRQPMLFCDTTPLMTAIYSRFYWGRVDAALAALARSTLYDYTVVTVPDGTWLADGLMRESPAVQASIHGMLIATLEEQGIAYQPVSGDPPQRVQQVVNALQETFGL